MLRLIAVAIALMACERTPFVHADSAADEVGAHATIPAELEALFERADHDAAALAALIEGASRYIAGADGDSGHALAQRLDWELVLGRCRSTVPPRFSAKPSGPPAQMVASLRGQRENNAVRPQRHAPQSTSSSSMIQGSASPAACHSTNAGQVRTASACAWHTGSRSTA